MDQVLAPLGIARGFQRFVQHQGKLGSHIACPDDCFKIVVLDRRADIAAHLGDQMGDADHALGVVGDLGIARLKADSVVQRQAAE
jgi:hypothetical protein